MQAAARAYGKQDYKWVETKRQAWSEAGGGIRLESQLLFCITSNLAFIYESN